MRIQNPNTDLKIGWCLDPHDLAASKLVAGREKDWVFVAEMLASKVVQGPEVLERIAALPIAAAQQKKLAAWVIARS